MPVTDKRFTTLIIQRSEKASKDPPALSVNTQQLAIQLVKSTAVYKKYRSVLDQHRAASPSLSPIGGNTPDLIASIVMPAVENSAMGNSGGNAIGDQQKVNEEKKMVSANVAAAVADDDSVDLDKEDGERAKEETKQQEVMTMKVGGAQVFHHQEKSAHQAVTAPAEENPEERGLGSGDDEDVKEIVLDLTKSDEAQ